MNHVVVCDCKRIPENRFCLLERDAVLAANRRKHGVSFEEAEAVFGNAFAITNDDMVHSSAEPRERTVGMSAKGRILVAITARRHGITRIISARRTIVNALEEYEK